MIFVVMSPWCSYGYCEDGERMELVALGVVDVCLTWPNGEWARNVITVARCRDNVTVGWWRGGLVMLGITVLCSWRCVSVAPWVSQVLREQPADIYRFGASYFTRLAAAGATEPPPPTGEACPCALYALHMQIYAVSGHVARKRQCCRCPRRAPLFLRPVLARL